MKQARTWSVNDIVKEVAPKLTNAIGFSVIYTARSHYLYICANYMNMINLRQCEFRERVDLSSSELAELLERLSAGGFETIWIARLPILIPSRTDQTELDVAFVVDLISRDLANFINKKGVSGIEWYYNVGEG